jgi:hypothetical protein
VAEFPMVLALAAMSPKAGAWPHRLRRVACQLSAHVAVNLPPPLCPSNAGPVDLPFASAHGETEVALIWLHGNFRAKPSPESFRGVVRGPITPLKITPGLNLYFNGLGKKVETQFSGFNHRDEN